MKAHRLTVGLVLVACTVAGCGSDSADGAPDDTSVADFCAAVSEVGGAIAGVEGERPTAEQLEAIQSASAAFGETGTPAEMNDDERAGFEIVVAFVANADSETTLGQLNDGADEGLDETGQEQVGAFGSFVEDTCFASDEE